MPRAQASWLRLLNRGPSEPSLRLLGVLLMSAVVGTALRPSLASAFADGTPSDAWDLSRGAIVTSSSGSVGVSSANDMLGGHDATVETGTTLFRDDQAAAFVHFIEWSTPTPVEIRAFSLYANDDGAQTKDRGFSEFRLFARNTGTLLFEQISSFTPAGNPYPDGEIELHALIAPPVVAKDFRAEFVQAAGTNTPARGPRIRELDAATALGDEDGGFVPPDKGAAKCEHKVAKLVSTLLAKSAACVRKAAKAAIKTKPFDESACKAAALTKFEAAGAKLSCPECIESAAGDLDEIATDRVDAAEPAIYCAGTTTFGSLGALVPPDKPTAKCADGVAKSLVKLAVAQLACHVKAAKKAFARKSFDEEACEDKAQAKYDAAQAKRIGCPVCLDAATIASTQRSTLDADNADIYCAF